jgi:hypothetical protein
MVMSHTGRPVHTVLGGSSMLGITKRSPSAVPTRIGPAGSARMDVIVEVEWARKRDP